MSRQGCWEMKRLRVVADNSLIVEGIRIGLRQRGHFELLGHVNARGASVKAIVEADPEVVLVDDVDRSERTLELIRGIKSANDGIAVIALTVDMDPDWLAKVFEAGAGGAISKA